MRISATLTILTCVSLMQIPSSEARADASDSFPAWQDEQQESWQQVQEPVKEESSQPQEEDVAAPQQEQGQALSTAPFKAFTGKITKNKVRIRTQPSLDSPILKELAQGDMLIVVGETEDFYAVQPPAGIKAYVFRAYILDNVVEANKVNVRLEPDLDSAVIAQLSSGDRISGEISSLNSKWLEIAPPANARFYVAKDYIEKLGDPSVMASIEKRRDELNHLMSSTYLISQTEMQKSFPEINLDGVYASYNKVINQYSDFPDQVAKAREMTAALQDHYLQKKIVYLEGKAKSAQDDWQVKNTQLTDQMKQQQQRLAQLEQQLKSAKDNKTSSAIASSNKPQNLPPGQNDKMAGWVPSELAEYQAWSKENNNRTQQEFYEEQRNNAEALSGIIEPYTRVIKNKPGDYILVNKTTNLPIAYLYSTQVNLQDKVGQSVTIYGSPRPNNNFAFPAYYVHWVD